MNITLNIAPGQGLFVNDSPEVLQLASADTRSARGGIVMVAGDGSFGYIPPSGYIGTDTFQYTVASIGGSAGTSSTLVDVAVFARFPAETSLSTLEPAGGGDGSAGFVLNGVSLGDRSGWSVSFAGDVNGDGFGDLLIGAHYANSQTMATAGETYLVFGSDDMPAEFDISNLFSVNGGDGSRGVVLSGAGAGDESGVSVSSAGDVNGDGFGDIIIGAFRADQGAVSNAGESYVVFGRSSFPAEIELASLFSANGGDGSQGFAVLGVNVNDQIGLSVGSAGDVNGDGFDDVVIGAPTASPGGRPQAGATYAVFGRPVFPAEFSVASLLAAGGGDGSKGAVFKGIDVGDQSGSSVASLGDVNGDDRDDFLIGARWGDPGARANAGEGYVIFGMSSFPAEFELSSLMTLNGGDGSQGVILKGVGDGDETGRSAASAGDYNNDGYMDFVIGAGNSDSGSRADAGSGYVVYGRSTFPAELELSSLLSSRGGDGSGGMVLHGAEAGDYLGWAVGSAGDINNDGFIDIVAGALCGNPGPGETYVIYGGSSMLAELDSANLYAVNGGDGSVGSVFRGVGPTDYSAWSVDAAGDVNGDGVHDIIIGAINGGWTAGKTYVVYGVK